MFEGAGLDGLIAKPADLPYEPGKRLMSKIKHARTADVVVAGFRWHKSGPVVGSLLLGLYDDEGVLHHVGVSASFTVARRAELLDELAPYRDAGASTRGLTGRPRATGQRDARAAAQPVDGHKDLSLEPLRPELVVEVGYDAMEGDRFRHTAQFERWRPDREPRSCTLRPARPAGPVRRRRGAGGRPVAPARRRWPGVALVGDTITAARCDLLAPAPSPARHLRAARCSPPAALPAAPRRRGRRRAGRAGRLASLPGGAERTCRPGRRRT